MITSYETLPKETIRHLYDLATIIVMADEIGERKSGFVVIPADWWQSCVLHKLNQLNASMPNQASPSE